ncbi:MAG: hypothetical protein HQ596_04425 [Candidatus Saganbacteria bacterium]|nr:hypothetical protein [Candidatus Saganbacteria bacterium]
MKKGAALILVILIFASFLILGALFSKIVYNLRSSAHAALVREQAFYLAEAGIEKGKVELAHNPNWYTDPPYYLEDNLSWLLNQAVGQEVALGEGKFKIVKESGKDRLYSIGQKGRGIMVIKIKLGGGSTWEII